MRSSPDVTSWPARLPSAACRESAEQKGHVLPDPASRGRLRSCKDSFLPTPGTPAGVDGACCDWALHELGLPSLLRPKNSKHFQTVYFRALGFRLRVEDFRAMMSNKRKPQRRSQSFESPNHKNLKCEHPEPSTLNLKAYIRTSLDVPPYTNSP